MNFHIFEKNMSTVPLFNMLTLIYCNTVFKKPSEKKKKKNYLNYNYNKITMS